MNCDLRIFVVKIFPSILVNNFLTFFSPIEIVNLTYDFHYYYIVFINFNKFVKNLSG